MGGKCEKKLISRSLSGSLMVQITLINVGIVREDGKMTTQLYILKGSKAKYVHSVLYDEVPVQRRKYENTKSLTPPQTRWINYMQAESPMAHIGVL
jgi:hypothetical protein